MPYKGGDRPKAQLNFNKEMYTPEGAKSLTTENLHKEYSRLRSIAQKRLKRFEGTEWEQTQVYKMNHDLYKPLKDIKSDRELRHLFSDIARFVSAETSSVSGLTKQRNKALESLHERGYDFVNKKNFRQFAEFMEYARVSSLNRLYDSKRVAEFYEYAERKGIVGDELQKAFRAWGRKERTLIKIQNINPRNSSMYRKDVK